MNKVLITRSLVGPLYMKVSETHTHTSLPCARNAFKNLHTSCMFQCQKIRSSHIIHLDSSCHTSSSVTSSYQSWNLTEWCPHKFFYRWMIGCRSLLINQPLKRRNVSIIVHSTNQRLRTSTCPISRGCWYRNCVGPWCSYSYQTWSRISIGTWFSCSYRPWIRILILGK